MKHGFKVMDSDMHIIAPPDLWQRGLSAAQRGARTELARPVLRTALGDPGGA